MDRVTLLDAVVTAWVSTENDDMLPLNVRVTGDITDVRWHLY